MLTAWRHDVVEDRRRGLRREVRDAVQAPRRSKDLRVVRVGKARERGHELAGHVARPILRGHLARAVLPATSYPSTAAFLAVPSSTTRRSISTSWAATSAEITESPTGQSTSSSPFVTRKCGVMGTPPLATAPVGAHELDEREGEPLAKGHRAQGRDVVLVPGLHEALDFAREVYPRLVPYPVALEALGEHLRAHHVLGEERHRGVGGAPEHLADGHVHRVVAPVVVVT